MEIFFIISILIFSVIIALSAFILISNEKPWERKKNYPRGHFLGIGVAIGLIIGMMLGVMMGVGMDNVALGIALGPSLGSGLGLSIGAVLDSKYRHRERKLSADEKKERKNLTIVASISLSLLIVFLSSILVLS